jgi:hypothetical protein
MPIVKGIVVEAIAGRVKVIAPLEVSATYNLLLDAWLIVTGLSALVTNTTSRHKAEARVAAAAAAEAAALVSLVDALEADVAALEALVEALLALVEALLAEVLALLACVVAVLAEEDALEALEEALDSLIAAAAALAAAARASASASAAVTNNSSAVIFGIRSWTREPTGHVAATVPSRPRPAASIVRVLLERPVTLTISKAVFPVLLIVIYE